MIDDAWPTDAIRRVTPPCFLPVVVGGNQHPFLPIESLTQRHQRRAGLAAGHGVCAFGEDVWSGHEDSFLAHQTGEDFRCDGVPLVALVPKCDEANRVEKDWHQG